VKGSEWEGAGNQEGLGLFSGRQDVVRLLRARRALARAGGARDRRVRQGRGTNCARKGRGAGRCPRQEDKSWEGRSTQREDDKAVHTRCSMTRQLL
jgi:hypothetical protein